MGLEWLTDEMVEALTGDAAEEYAEQLQLMLEWEANARSLNDSAPLTSGERHRMKTIGLTEAEVIAARSNFLGPEEDWPKDLPF